MDLPDAENRLKILKIFLTPENLEPGFQFEKLAKETEGYSGSDLKVGTRFQTPQLVVCALYFLDSFSLLWFLYFRIYALLLLTDLFKNSYRKNKRYKHQTLPKLVFLLLDVLSCLSPQGEGADASPCLRPLSLDDFIQSKAKVLF